MGFQHIVTPKKIKNNKQINQRKRTMENTREHSFAKELGFEKSAEERAEDLSTKPVSQLPKGLKEYLNAKFEGEIECSMKKLTKYARVMEGYPVGDVSDLGQDIQHTYDFFGVKRFLTVYIDPVLKEQPFHIMNRCLKALEDSGWSNLKFQNICNASTKGDFDFYLRVMRHFFEFKYKSEEFGIIESNAVGVVRDWNILFMDNGILTMYVWLKMLDKSGVWTFGGYNLGNKCFVSSDYTFSEWIRKLFEVTGVDSLNLLKGAEVRIERDGDRVVKIGHLSKDIWFDPKDHFSRLEKMMKADSMSLEKLNTQERLDKEGVGDELKNQGSDFEFKEGMKVRVLSDWRKGQVGTISSHISDEDEWEEDEALDGHLYVMFASGVRTTFKAEELELVLES